MTLWGRLLQEIFAQSSQYGPRQVVKQNGHVVVSRTELKNYMRSMTKEDRLNGLALMMATHPGPVPVESIIDTFVARHPQEM